MCAMNRSLRSKLRRKLHFDTLRRLLCGVCTAGCCRVIVCGTAACSLPYAATLTFGIPLSAYAAHVSRSRVLQVARAQNRSLRLA